MMGNITVGWTSVHEKHPWQYSSVGYSYRPGKQRENTTVPE
jgi:hypothetical protein